MNRLSIIGLVIVIIFVLVAICPWIAHYDVGATNRDALHAALCCALVRH
jgi:hypothetical protein